MSRRFVPLMDRVTPRQKAAFRRAMDRLRESRKQVQRPWSERKAAFLEDALRQVADRPDCVAMGANCDQCPIRGKCRNIGYKRLKPHIARTALAVVRANEKGEKVLS